jgi:hypothetical protein
MTDNDAKKLWKDVFGNREWAQDCFGTWMHRDAHSNDVVSKIKPGDSKSYDYSWNVDHIRPKSNYADESEADDWNNYEPMHRQNNLAKGDNYPYFTIDGRKYQVVKNTYGGYGIADVQTGRRIDWKAIQNRHYK